MTTSIVLPPEPDRIDLASRRQRAALRVWAAHQRDRGPAAAWRRARPLCITLDLLPTGISTALRQLMEADAKVLAAKVREMVG